MSIRVALYVRTSVGKGEQDPNAQLQPIRELCKLRGWEIAREFVDDGYSGSHNNRPALAELMNVIDRGYEDFHAVVVWKFDRFSRSIRYLLETLDRFSELGIQFISVTEPIEPGTSYGKFVFACLAAVAELERNLIGERIRNGMRKQGAKKPGRRVSSNGPSKSTLWRRKQKQS